MLLKVPLDIVPPENLPLIITELKDQNIILLSVWDLLKARRNSEYLNYLFDAALIIPISKSLVSGAKFLTGKKPVRYMPFNFIISLLSIIEKKEGSLYLLGGGSRVLRKAERNLRSTFPNLKIVGRSDRKTCKQEESAVIEAIRKASPDLLLAGSGIREGEMWITRNTSQLNSGFRLWCSDLFDVLAEKRKRPTDAIFERGLESIGFCLQNPFKFFRIFAWLYYMLLLLIYRFIKKY